MIDAETEAALADLERRGFPGHARLRHNVARGLRGADTQARSLAATWRPGTQRMAATPVSPPISPAGRLVVRTAVTPYTGYGQHAQQTGRGLERLGIPVAFDAEGVSAGGHLPLDEWVQGRLAPGSAEGGPAVLHQLPPGNVPREGAARLAFLSMWETSRLRSGDERNLNRANVVIVPDRWNEEVFKASGVTAPIRLAPLGIDPSIYHDDGTPPPSTRGGPVVFGAAGRLAHGGIRKGLPDVIAAFRLAFPRQSDRSVALRVKVWPDCDLGEPNDPRIVVDRRPLSAEELADWYRGLDVYVTASRGEGWGMQTQQAMSVGRPVAAIPWSATTAFWREGLDGWAIPFSLQPAAGLYADCGEWAVPDVGGLAELLKGVAADPDGRRTRGLSAATRAAEWTWERHARSVLDALKEFGVLPRTAAKPALPPARPEVRPEVREQLRLQKLARECPHRGCKVGCQKTACGRFGAEVYLSQCVECRRREESGETLTAPPAA